MKKNYVIIRLITDAELPVVQTALDSICDELKVGANWHLRFNDMSFTEEDE